MTRPLTLAPTRLAVLSIVFLVADLASRPSRRGALSAGVLDEIAHACTAVLVVWLLGRQASERLLTGALVASVAIDLDHLPDLLGFGGLTAGTPRPYPHSLLTVAVLAAAASVSRARRDFLGGAVLGLLVHFWRDLSEPGSAVSLLWPFSYQAFSISHASYLAVMAAVIAADAWRGWIAGRSARPPIPPL